MVLPQGAGQPGANSQRLLSYTTSDAYGYPQSQLGTSGGGSSGAAPSSQRRRAIIACSIGAALMVAALVGVLAWGVPAIRAAHARVRSVTASGHLDEAFCGKMPGLDAQRACHAYLFSPGRLRFQVANDWGLAHLASYECAGISPECMNADTMADKPGLSTCKPMPGADCGTEIDFEEIPSLGGGKVYKLEEPLSRTGLTVDQVLAKRARGEKLDDDDKWLLSIAWGKPAPKDPVSGWGWFQATPVPSESYSRVPATFLATSHEWDRMTDYANNIGAFKAIFKELGPSPIIRMGGASQDFLTDPPPKEIWQALQTLHRELNASFIIGLPLWRHDAVDDARAMMQIAEQWIPKSHIVGYELGNEPEFWLTGVGGYDVKEPTKFVPGFEAYVQYFHRVAKALNDCKDGKSNPVLAGPGWGNVNTIDAKWMAMQAKMEGVKCYMRELSVHYYPYVNNVTIDSKGLLAQDLQNFGLDKFKWLQGVAKAVGLGLRVSETNSLYGGGRSGLSDTMAGALWCADALFAFASTGASGFHFHWGFGGQPLQGGQPNTGVQTNFFTKAGEIGPPTKMDDVGGPYPSVHAPWYSYLLFRLATAGEDNGFSDTKFVKTDTAANDCKANMKVWSLLADDGSLRVAILNKDGDASCNVNVNLEGRFCGKSGRLSRLMPGIKGMDSYRGITWQGQTYDETTNGYRRGDRAVDYVAPRYANGKCSMTVPMPPASGAVLEVPSSGARRLMGPAEAEHPRGGLFDASGAPLDKDGKHIPAAAAAAAAAKEGATVAVPEAAKARPAPLRRGFFREWFNLDHSAAPAKGN